jgi:hypothetical protein
MYMRLVALAFAIVVLLTPAAPCTAAGFRIEAESMIATHNLGGYAISVVSCSGASGGLAVNGLDNPGEWIEFRLELAAATAFIDSLHSAGLVGEIRHFAVQFLTGDDPTGAPGDTVTTGPGRGFS